MISFNASDACVHAGVYEECVTSLRLCGMLVVPTLDERQTREQNTRAARDPEDTVREGCAGKKSRAAHVFRSLVSLSPKVGTTRNLMFVLRRIHPASYFQIDAITSR